jgi:DNA-binding NarL/FixJ family response regulator
MAQGVPSIKMARTLDLAEGTIHDYISRIRAKLGVVGRLGAALYACRLGLTVRVSSD